MLTREQISTLAKPFVGMGQAMADFFKDPQNEQEYQEWYKSKYGHYPHDEGVRE